MNDDHGSLRESLGAYVLGALDPAERATVEAHLGTCAACRDEVAALAALPPLLQRLTREEATSGHLLPSADLGARVRQAAATERLSLDRRLRRWRVATGVASAAAVALLLAWAPWSAPTQDRLVAAARAEAGVATEGTAAAIAWEWGTTIELDIERLPLRDTYVLWAVSREGERLQAGTWGRTRARSAYVRGASAIARPDLERVEVTDTDGEVLVSFDFSA